MLCFILEDCTACLLVNNVVLQTLSELFLSWSGRRRRVCVVRNGAGSSPEIYPEFFITILFTLHLMLPNFFVYCHPHSPLRSGYGQKKKPLCCLAYLFWKNKYLGPFAVTILKLV